MSDQEGARKIDGEVWSTGLFGPAFGPLSPERQWRMPAAMASPEPTERPSDYVATVGPFQVLCHLSQEAWDEALINEKTKEDAEASVGFSDTDHLELWVKPIPGWRVTLLHELMHVLLNNGQQSLAMMLATNKISNYNVEEIMVSHLAPWMIMLMQDNPELIKMLSEVDSSFTDM